MTRPLYEITLPLPPKDASPNARPGWRAKAKAVAMGRNRAGDECYVQVAERPEMAIAMISTTWRLRTAKTGSFRRQDPDNLLAWAKCYFDGLQDARLLSDDDRIIHMPPRQIAAGIGVDPSVTLAVRPIHETSEQILNGISQGMDMVDFFAVKLLPIFSAPGVSVFFAKGQIMRAMRDGLKADKWINPNGNQE